MFKVKIDLLPNIVNDTFLEQSQTQYNLQYHSDFETLLIRSVYHGSESMSFLGPNIWNSLHSALKELEYLNSFKA